MANKDDDLFAGLTIGTRKVPNQQQQAATAAGVPEQNADLFAGLTIGNTQIPAATPGLLQEPTPPGQQFQPIAQQRQIEPATTPFPEQPGETRAARELPEVVDSGILAGESGARIAAITPVLLTTTNPLEFANILKSTFPENINFQTSPAGEIIIANNRTGERAVVNQEGFSAQDVIQGLGLISAFTPAARGAALATGVGARVLAGGAGAGLTQTAIEGIQSQLGGELDPEEIAVATALGGVAETVVPAIQAIRQSRRAAGLGIERAEVAATREAIRPAQEAVEAVEAVTGQRVGLFPAQQTQVPSELLKQRILPQLDASAKKAASALETQNKEVFDATATLINTIAPEGSIVGASKKFRAAADKSIRAARKSRSAAVRPLYNEAFREAREQGLEADLNPIIQFVNDELKGLVKDDPAAVALNSFVTRLKGEVVPGIPPSTILDAAGNPIIPGTAATTKPLTLEQLQSAKLTTDAKIDKMGGIVPSAAQKNAKRLLSQVERMYVDQLGEISPKFKAANAEFARLSPAVTELEDSILGQVAKASDTQLKNIAQKIFDPKAGLTDPSAIVKAKRVIDATDPDAWNNLMRVEMNRRVGGLVQIAEDATGDLVGNVPGQLRSALFGNPSQRKALLSGMNAEQKKNFGYLESVLKRAASGRAAGSPTAAFGEAIGKLRGVSGVIRDLIFRPLKTLGETGERGLFDRNVSALTDVMFDPRFEPQLRLLRTLSPDSPAAVRAFSQLINTAQDRENK